MKGLHLVFCLALIQPIFAFAKPLHIVNDKVLFLTHLSVVEDKLRTSNSCDPTNVPAGQLPVWSFGRLMKEMSGDKDPSDFVLSWLNSWKNDQIINGDKLRARPLINDLIIKPWLARSNSQASGIKNKLDLQKAPFRLLSINYRADLRDRSKSKAGEARFIFAALDQDCNTLPFTVIFEYRLPANSCDQTLSWANQFHSLSKLAFGSTFNAALESITNKFTLAQSDTSLPNGNLLSQLRTNEIALGQVWQLREFRISPLNGNLRLATAKQTPKLGLNNTAQLRDYLNTNSKKILEGKHIVPLSLLAGKSDTPFNLIWNARGVKSNEVRHKFALNTCSGCHTTETGTSFVHVSERRLGEESTLSGFLTGTSLPDPVNFEQRDFADLQRRASDLTVLLNTTCETTQKSASMNSAFKLQADPSKQFYCNALLQQNYPNGPYGKKSNTSVSIVTADVDDIPNVDLSGLEKGCLSENSFEH